MTSRELQISVKQDLEERGVTARLFSDDLFRVLTEAQEEIYRAYFRQFEETREITDVLQSLVKRSTELTATVAYESVHGYVVDPFALPLDFGYYLSGSAGVAYLRNGEILYTVNNGVREPSGTYSTRRRSARHVQSDDIYRVLDDPFSTSTYDKPVVTSGEDEIAVYTDKSFVATAFYLDYLSQPSPINKDDGASLPEREHPRLVTAAVQLILPRIAQPSQSQ